MQKVISALNRQIKIETDKCKQREMMLANKDAILFNEPLPDANEDYLKELKQAVSILENVTKPMEDWTKVVEGKISVPDELDPLVNSIGIQLRFHTISGKGEVETVCHIAYNAQKFFKERFKNK